MWYEVIIIAIYFTFTCRFSSDTQTYTSFQKRILLWQLNQMRMFSVVNSTSLSFKQSSHTHTNAHMFMRASTQITDKTERKRILMIDYNDSSLKIKWAISFSLLFLSFSFSFSSATHTSKQSGKTMHLKVYGQFMFMWASFLSYFI